MGGGPGSLTGYGPYGHKESDKTEATKHARMQTAWDVMIGQVEKVMFTTGI